jgi:hypothetical protein
MRRSKTLLWLATAALLAASSAARATVLGPSIQATTAAASSLVLQAAPGNLLALEVTATSAPGFVLVLDATAAPTSGSAVTPALCYPVAAAANVSLLWNSPPYFPTGITVLFSTGTDCFTYTSTPTAFISGQAEH